MAPGSGPSLPPDDRLLRALASHLHRHAVGCFDDGEGGPEQDRAQALIEWFAESVEVLNVPRPDQYGGPCICRPAHRPGDPVCPG